MARTWARGEVSSTRRVRGKGRCRRAGFQDGNGRAGEEPPAVPRQSPHTPWPLCPPLELGMQSGREKSKKRGEEKKGVGGQFQRRETELRSWVLSHLELKVLCGHWLSNTFKPWNPGLKHNPYRDPIYELDQTELSQWDEGSPAQPAIPASSIATETRGAGPGALDTQQGGGASPCLPSMHSSPPNNSTPVSRSETTSSQPYDFTYMWDLKNKINEHTKLKQTQRTD